MRARPHNKVGVRGSNMRADGVRAFCQPSPAGNGPICKVNAVGVAETGVEHCSPAKNHKVTFLLSYFSVTKSTKSQQREHSPLFANLRGVHELAARAMRGKCVRQMAERKSAILRSAQSRLYHACEQSARKSRADSCTHCLHARYKCRAGVAPVPALTG